MKNLSQEERENIAYISMYQKFDLSNPIDYAHINIDKSEIKTIPDGNTWSKVIRTAILHWSIYHAQRIDAEWSGNVLSIRLWKPHTPPISICRINTQENTVEIGDGHKWYILDKEFSIDHMEFINYIANMLKILDEEFSQYFTDSTPSEPPAETVSTNEPISQPLAGITAVLNHLMNTVTLELSRALSDETKKSLKIIRNQVNYAKDYITDILSRK